MTAATGTFQTYAAKGIKEDLSDVISNIAPTETPFMSNAGKGKVSSTFFEFQTDTLATAVTTNAQIEGDDISSYDSVTATVRLGNYTQIARKTVVIAGTQEAVDKAGRKSEIAYQLAKKGKELKRDIEAGCLDNQAASAGNSATARYTGSFLVHLKTNVNKDAGGVIPVYTTVANDVYTNGTTRTFTEIMLKDVIQQCWTAGANPKTLMVGGTVKQTVSAFSGVVTRNLNQTSDKPTSIIGAADVYVSDFGNINIIPNRFQRVRDAFVIDWDYVEIDYLRPFQTEELAKTGDAEKRLLIVEYGVRVKNEKAHGVAVDLKP